MKDTAARARQRCDVSAGEVADAIIRRLDPRSIRLQTAPPRRP
jgi:hypothetical protein